MMRLKNMVRLLPFAAVIVLAGCHQVPHIYHWGVYEDLIYADYASPGTLPLQEQAMQLETDIQNAANAGRPTPPGVYAQLGYVYFKMGRSDAARHAFDMEKKLFPESGVFMDRLIAKLATEKQDENKKNPGDVS